LSTLSDYVLNNGAPVELVVPKADDIMAQLYFNGEPTARSAVYRIWPYREDMIAGLFKHLIKNDPYPTQTIEAESHKVIDKTIGISDESSPDASIIRKMVINKMGTIAISSTNHVAISRIEATVQAWPKETGLGEILTSTTDQYINTLATNYELVHSRLGDTLTEGVTFRDYGKCVATLGRAIALNPFNLEAEAQQQQYTQFQHIADNFTQSQLIA
jgi:hypothetical protein